MWFKSTYLKTLRDFRIGILGWGVGVGLLMFVLMVAYPSVAATPQARAALVSLASGFAWLAEPIRLDTPGGYATWKYGLTLLVIALWPLLTATRLLRGEEEKGSMDALLSLPRSRGRVALEKVAAMGTALLAMSVLIGLLTYAGGRSVNADFGLGESLLFGLNLVLIAGVFGGLALLVSQFTQERRSASGATGGLLFVFIVVDTIHRVIPNTEWISRLSPVYYYNLSKPLIPSYGTNGAAMMFMLALSVVLSAAGVWLFVRRDIGGVVPMPRFLRLPQRAAQPRRGVLQGEWSLRSVYSRSLATMAMPTFWWTIVIAGFGAWMVVIVKQTEAQLASILQGSPQMSYFLKLSSGGDTATNASILSAFYIFLLLLLMAFAVTQAGRWAADEEDGRLELVLSTPQPRLQVLLGRFAALSTATIVISVLTLASTEVASVTAGVALDGGNLAAASLSMIPLGLLVAALGYLFSGWLKSSVDTGLLSFLLVIWFVIDFIGPGLSWPAATLRLSALYYYGTPLVNGLPVLDTLAVVAVAALALALAALRFTRKDIAV